MKKIFFHNASLVLILLLFQAGKLHSQTILPGTGEESGKEHRIYNFHSLQSANTGNPNGVRKTTRGFLTDSKYYFLYYPSFLIDNPARSLQLTIDAFHSIDASASKLFDPNDLSENINIFLPLWAVLYANDDQADRSSHKFAFGLICAGKYDEAQKMLLENVEKKQSYGTLVLLGLLSMRDKSLFKYLKEAYLQSPAKTIIMINYLACNVQIDVLDVNEWDFLDAYIKLFLTDEELFRTTELSDILLHRLSELVRQKYFDHKTDQTLQEDNPQEVELRNFRVLMTELSQKRFQKRINNPMQLLNK
ncbi:hypothetical protein SDC9_117925 [bioreactor metagenome]|uniref:Uncharacterized protein n=1 Tax=bioreactor metagenome TaxID=1076179 RepID=A0A645C035_9ZZZZ